jgi:hypothetical protein
MVLGRWSTDLQGVNFKTKNVWHLHHTLGYAHQAKCEQNQSQGRKQGQQKSFTCHGTTMCQHQSTSFDNRKMRPTLVQNQYQPNEAWPTHTQESQAASKLSSIECVLVTHY